jgi:hypothetical protein
MALLLGKTAGSVALHWSSLNWACCSVKPESELIRLFPTKVFADLLLSLVTLRLTESATRTALLELNVLTLPSHLADWHIFPYIFGLELDPM